MAFEHLNMCTECYCTNTSSAPCMQTALSSCVQATFRHIPCMHAVHKQSMLAAPVHVQKLKCVLVQKLFGSGTQHAQLFQECVLVRTSCI